MESCINLASKALGVRAPGIVRSAAQQPGILLIGINTQSTRPILFGLHLHSNPQHIESRDTLRHSSIYFLGHFAMIAMPPKGNTHAASEALGPKVEWNKHDRGSLPNHYTVDNWKGFLPKKILEAVLAVKVSGSKTRKMRTIVSTGKRV